MVVTLKWASLSPVSPKYPFQTLDSDVDIHSFGYSVLGFQCFCCFCCCFCRRRRRLAVATTGGAEVTFNAIIYEFIFFAPPNRTLNAVCSGVRVSVLFQYPIRPQAQAQARAKTQTQTWSCSCSCSWTWTICKPLANKRIETCAYFMAISAKVATLLAGCCRCRSFNVEQLKLEFFPRFGFVWRH